VNRIAILHGGPSDRQQHVVDRYSDVIYVDVLEPIPTLTVKSRGKVDPDVGVVRKARYERVSAAVNPGRDWMYRRPGRIGCWLPDQEVVLYVYVGQEE
jgi:hypothetical protein